MNNIKYLTTATLNLPWNCSPEYLWNKRNKKINLSDTYNKYYINSVKVNVPNAKFTKISNGVHHLYFNKEIEECS